MAPLPRLAIPRRALALSASLLLVWSCSHLRVDTDYDTEVDFSKFHSFTWLEPPVTSEPSESPVEDLIDPFEKNSLLDKRVRQAVEQELLARGYRRAADGRSEFQLQYHVILKDRMKVRSYPYAHYGYRSYPYGYGGAVGGVSSYNYKEGTLIIDIVDASTRQLAWRGWAVGVNRAGYYTDEKVGAVVNAVLARFPPEGVKVVSEAEHLRHRVRELEEQLREVDDQGQGQAEGQAEGEAEAGDPSW
jgi:hypothetical protein